MITLNRLGHHDEPFHLNIDMIVTVESTPDTSGFGSTIGGELEMSNVDMATEMTNMITAERGYQANSRTITTADEMLGTLVSMVQ